MRTTFRTRPLPIIKRKIFVVMSTIRTRFCRRRPLSDLKKLTIMFETLELQNLNKLSESKIGDFTSPKTFHTVKVQRLGHDGIKPAAEVSRTFVVPAYPSVSMPSRSGCVRATSSGAVASDTCQRIYHRYGNIASRLPRSGYGHLQGHRTCYPSAYSVGDYVSFLCTFCDSVFVFSWIFTSHVLNPYTVGRKPTRNLAIALCMSANVI